MKRKVLALLSICVLSFGLVACSNKENIQTEELPKKRITTRRYSFSKNKERRNSI